MNTIRLSLCMIVRNEEDTLEQCLNSIKDIVDEIIIVDTGSTDRTIEICQSFKAKIEKFEWNDSFADARNYGIEKATGDWIIWLDADEELDEEAKQKLNNGTHFHDFDVITLHLINYYGDQKDIDNTTEIAHIRLFRHNGIKFINKMHECLDLKKILQERIGHLNVKVHHYGYLNPIVEKKEKSTRNLKLLQNQIKEGENVHWAYYFIALDYYNKQMYQEALDQVNLSVLYFLSNKVLPPSMVYKLKYSILIALGKFDTALIGIDKAISLYPDFVDLHFFKGVILYHLDKYDDAITCFRECLELGEDNKNHLILKGVGSFQAWHYISLCQDKLNKSEDAIIALMESLLISPQYKKSLETLDLYISNKELPVVDYMNKNYKDGKRQKLIQILKK